MKQNRRTPSTPIETGQLWQLEDSNVRIGLIGKTLVHYKHFRTAAPRAPVSLTTIGVLEKFLFDKKAVLVKDTLAKAVVMPA